MKKRNLFLTVFVVLFAVFNAQAKDVRNAQCAFTPKQSNCSKREKSKAKKWLENRGNKEIKSAAKKAGISVTDSEIKAGKKFGSKFARKRGIKVPKW